MATAPRNPCQVELVCHRETPCPTVRSLVATLDYRSNHLRLRYCLTGNLALLRIPTPQTPVAGDRLWAHTCFEAFTAAAAGNAYREWNFSPSGQWAQYAFSGYRERAIANDAGGRIAAPVIDVHVSSDLLELDARIGLPPLDCARVAIGISAVVEHIDGGLSYWALRHPSMQPDFHHREGFALTLELAGGGGFSI